MRFDIILKPHRPAAEMARLAKLAEGYGIGAIWVPNNILSRDPFVNFVPTAQQTTRIRMGAIAVSPFELPPLRMANLLLTLNEFSAGRAAIVIGGGGGTAQAMGAQPKRRVRAVRECVEILKQAASGKRGGYKGEIYPTGWIDASWMTAPPPAIYVGANGPQMLAMAARHADGIMLSDIVPGRVRWARGIIDPVLRERGLEPGAFALNNFWAWHVKPSREQAEREARIYLAVRGTIWDPYIHDVVGEDEAAIVLAHSRSFVNAYQRKDPEIAGVPDSIVKKIVDHGVSASAEADIDREIERFREFRRAGLNQVALCLYDDPEDSIRLIGEQLVPAFT